MRAPKVLAVAGLGVAAVAPSSTAAADELRTGPGVVITDLGNPAGGGFASARDINGDGTVIGLGTTATGATRSFVWDAGETTVLPGDTTAAAVNASGQV